MRKRKNFDYILTSRKQSHTSVEESVRRISRICVWSRENRNTHQARDESCNKNSKRLIEESRGYIRTMVSFRWVFSFARADTTRKVTEVCSSQFFSRQIKRTTERRQWRGRGGRHGRIRGMSCKSIERLTSVTYLVDGFEAGPKIFSGSSRFQDVGRG